MKDGPDPIDFSAIIASSAHDMKNALGMLLDGIDQIGAKYPPEEFPASEELERLRHEGKRVNNYLIQLLALYRVENALYSPIIDEHNVSECLLECQLENEGVLSTKGIAIDMECDPELYWFFDRTMLISSINSVLNNAYKYTKDRVLLSTQVEDGYLIVSVDDNGPGYPEKMLLPDAGGQPPINLKTGGTGLGFYLASTVALMHKNKGRKGHISISNDGIDGGGRFSIYLP